MNQSAAVKLHELRSKTDRELVSLINNQLDRGLASARVLEGDGVNDWAAREQFAVSAEAALNEATKWMSLLPDTTRQERRRLEFKLAQLRSAVARVRPSELRVHAAC